MMVGGGTPKSKVDADPATRLPLKESDSLFGSSAMQTLIALLVVPV